MKPQPNQPKQLFVAVGRNPDGAYIYAFSDCDEAMEFVEQVSQHKDDGVEDWEIITDPFYVSAADAYNNHRQWVDQQ